MASGNIPGVPLALISIGGVLVYSGIQNQSITNTLGSLFRGQKPSPGPGQDVADSGSSGGSGSSVGIPTPTNATGNAAKNQAVGRLLAAGYGWATGSQWNALVDLWNQESGWNQFAENSASGAYGIPQSLPYTKMPKAAWPASAGGSSSVTAQISWGLQYIKSRYGSPEAAWAHEQANNWY